MNFERALLIPAVIMCAPSLSAQDQQPSQEDFTSWINFDFSNYHPSFSRNEIRGGCKIYVESVYFVGNFSTRGDYRKHYFRALENTTANKDNATRIQPQLQVALGKWLEQKGFEVTHDKSCTASVALELNFGNGYTPVGTIPNSKEMKGLYDPYSIVLHNEAGYKSVDTIKARPQAKLIFLRNGHNIKETALTGAVGIFVKYDVTPPMAGFGFFSTKMYSGMDLLENKVFTITLGKVIEESITKCLDKFGSSKYFDSESIADIVHDLK